jgi:hypothetical protein
MSITLSPVSTVFGLLPFRWLLLPREAEGRDTEPGQRITTPAHLPPHKAQGLQPAATYRERARAIGPYTAQAIELLLADPVIDRHSSAVTYLL